jgi:hypothetical protein
VQHVAHPFGAAVLVGMQPIGRHDSSDAAHLGDPHGHVVSRDRLLSRVLGASPAWSRCVAARARACFVEVDAAEAEHAAG